MQTGTCYDLKTYNTSCGQKRRMSVESEIGKVYLDSAEPPIIVHLLRE